MERRPCDAVGSRWPSTRMSLRPHRGKRGDGNVPLLPVKLNNSNLRAGRPVRGALRPRDKSRFQTIGDSSPGKDSMWRAVGFVRCHPRFPCPPVKAPFFPAVRGSPHGSPWLQTPNCNSQLVPNKPSWLEKCLAARLFSAATSALSPWGQPPKAACSLAAASAFALVSWDLGCRALLGYRAG